MTENIAFVSSYADPPEVQVRDLPVFAIKNEPGSIYGAIKRHFNDLWHNHSRPGKFLSDTQLPEQSAGGLVYWMSPDGIP